VGNKNKLQKFSDMSTYPNVVQPSFEEVFGKEHPFKGNWIKDFFHNDHPIVLELGCGKGEYTVGLARKYPDKNFLGIDIKGARMWKGATRSLEEKLFNVGFLRTRIEFIQSFFTRNEVSEIWITFPDPQLKRLRAKKRLTSSGFLNKYREFLTPEGFVHLKTDSRELYDYTLRVIEYNHLEILDKTEDLYGTSRADDILSIRTHYETLFMNQGFTIKYLRFKINTEAPLREPPEEITE